MAAFFLFACTFPVEPRASCAAYVTCVEARDARDGTSTDVVRFTPEGDCWTTARGADLCDRSCVSGLTFLRERDASLPEACR